MVKQEHSEKEKTEARKRIVEAIANFNKDVVDRPQELFWEAHQELINKLDNAVAKEEVYLTQEEIKELVSREENYMLHSIMSAVQRPYPVMSDDEDDDGKKYKIIVFRNKQIEKALQWFPFLAGETEDE